LAKIVLKERDEITVYDFIEAIEGIDITNDAKQDIESNLKVIQKMRVSLLENENPNILRQEFEKWDKNHQGI